MNKRKFGKKLNRSRSARRALYQALTVSLVEHGKIETTLAKAKAVQGGIDKMLRKATEKDINTLRSIRSDLFNDRKLTAKLFDVAAQSNKKSGFTRIIKTGFRRGDNAPMARLELTFALVKKEEVKEKKAKTDKKETKAQNNTKKVEKKAKKEVKNQKKEKKIK